MPAPTWSACATGPLRLRSLTHALGCPFRRPAEDDSRRCEQPPLRPTYRPSCGLAADRSRTRSRIAGNATNGDRPRIRSHRRSLGEHPASAATRAALGLLSRTSCQPGSAYHPLARYQPAGRNHRGVGLRCLSADTPVRSCRFHRTTSVDRRTTEGTPTRRTDLAPLAVTG